MGQICSIVYAHHATTTSDKSSKLCRVSRECFFVIQQPMKNACYNLIIKYILFVEGSSFWLSIFSMAIKLVYNRYYNSLCNNKTVALTITKDIYACIIGVEALTYSFSITARQHIENILSIVNYT